MTDDPRPHPYSVELSARPLRAAFIVDVADCPAELLDDLFMVNYFAWGGRLRPIVPSENGTLAPMYRRLIQRVDPDIVYSYCDLTDEEVDWIDRDVHPWSLSRHRTGRQQFRGRPDCRPYLAFHPIRAVGAIPEMFKGPAYEGPLIPTFVSSNASDEWAHHRWFARNFGIHHPEGAPRPVPTWPRTVAEDGWNDIAILKKIAKARFPVLAACASAAQSGTFRPRGSVYGSEYCLVVGDTPSDWLMFWNQVFAISPHQWTRWHTLCVAAERFDDPHFVDALRTFLARHAGRSGNHSPELFLRSTSVGSDHLSDISKRIAAQPIDVLYRIEHLAPWSIREVRPEEQDTFPIFDPPYVGDGPQRVEQQALSNRVLLQRPPAAVPLSEEWVLDVDVEFQTHDRFVMNEQLWWTLPRRVGLAQLFIEAQGRVNGRHSLSFAMRDRQATGNLTLSVPSEEAVLRVALMNPSPGMFADDDLRTPRDAPYQDFRLSDKGGYVKGVVDLFGGLHAASSFFGNSFWRSVVEHACNRSPANDQATLQPIQNKLRKVGARLRRDLEQGNFESLSRFVLSVARAEPTRDVDLTWEWLEQRFTRQRRSFVELHADYFRDATPEERARDDERAVRDLRRALQSYVESGVFFQGFRYRCNACGFGFWRSVSDARQVVDCEGCRAEVAIRVEEGWTYRLNSLVRNAVAHYGTIPVIWTLASLRWRSRSMFLYSPGVELFRSDNDPHPVSDLDVACVQDGKLLIGEVKTSPSEFNDETLKKLGEVATHLAVDGVVVAAFRSDEPQIRRVAERLESQFPHRAFSVIRLAPSSEVNEPVPRALASERWRL